MLRHTYEVPTSLLNLSVLYDNTLQSRIEKGKIPLTVMHQTRGVKRLVTVGRVIEMYVSNGVVNVKVVFKLMATFFFDDLTETELQPMLLDYMSKQRLLRFNVGKKTM